MGIVFIQIRETDTILKNVQEIHHTIGTKITQTIAIGNILLVDHEYTLTIDLFTTITIIDPEKTLRIQTTTTQRDKEIIFSHNIETMRIFQVPRLKTKEVVHKNIKDKSKTRPSRY